MSLSGNAEQVGENQSARSERDVHEHEMGKVRFSFITGGNKVAQVLDYGANAERATYDQIWIADHLSDIPPDVAALDPWTVLAAIGSKTTRIRLGSGVTDAVRIHPAKLASVVATLDNLTNGRAVLGIGAGELMNVAPYGLPWEPVPSRVARVKEFLQVMKLLWASSYQKPVSFRGEFYTLDRAHVDFPPIQKPHPLIYIGCFASARMLRLAGEVADGWLPGSYNNPDSYRDRISIVRDACERAGRDFHKMDMIATVCTMVGTDQKIMTAAKEGLKKKMVFERYIARLLGVEEEMQGVPAELQYQLITPSEDSGARLKKVLENFPVSDDVIQKGVDEMMAVGTADHCIESLSRFVKAGATHINISTRVPGWENYENVAKKVMPYVS